VVYSALDAVQLAARQPDREVIFLGVGFETTAPTIAAAIISARRMNLKNFSIYCAHKTVPVALSALMDSPSVQIDGFLLPGHVSVIIGLNAYRPFFDQYRIPSVVAGFEPVDVLRAVLELVIMFEKGRPGLGNVYPRAVTAEGNTRAQHVLAKVFEPCDASWRGLGVIPGSGLAIRSEYADFDAVRRFELQVVETPEPKGCACGEILSGTKTPPECELFRKACTPMNPVGPCMVSSEGTCSAYYTYDWRDSKLT
jgi:hydrogenase expression/formation protein HypD